MMLPLLSVRTKNAADAERFLIAANRLVELLLRDPRVEAAYRRWREASGLRALMPAVREAVKAGRAPGDAMGAEFLLAFHAAGLVAQHTLPALCLELGLPYPWLMIQLSSAFQLQAAAEAFDGVAQLALVIPPQRMRSRGRRAKNDGDSLRLAAEWFYRVHIQQPAESVRALAREYTAVDRAKRQGDGRSNIQAGIARARALFEQAEYNYAPLPK